MIKTRTRKLENGKWVGEVKAGMFRDWKPVDAESPAFTWSWGDYYIPSCFCSSQETAEKAIVSHLAIKYGL